jgi:hypothetical protein
MAKKRMVAFLILMTKSDRNKFWIAYDKVYLTLLFSILGLYFLLPYID